MKHHYPHDNPHVARPTARGIVIKDKYILLIERWREGLHYFSIPGGGIEVGEEPKETAEREILEETSIKVVAGQKLYVMKDPVGHVHTIFMCEYVSGEPNLPSDSEEAQSMNAKDKKDIYIPQWIRVEELAKLPFLYWAPVGRQLAKDIKNGWSGKPKILHSD